MGKIINKTVAAIIVVIAVVIFMTAMATLLPAFNSSGLNESQLCGGAGCFFNASRTVDCTTTNQTPDDTVQCIEAGASMPLSGFFNTSGVMPLVFGAMVIILAILFMLVMFKKRSGN